MDDKEDRLSSVLLPVLTKKVLLLLEAQVALDPVPEERGMKSRGCTTKQGEIQFGNRIRDRAAPLHAGLRGAGEQKDLLISRAAEVRGTHTGCYID